jgi:hypothetical protein
MESLPPRKVVTVPMYPQVIMQPQLPRRSPALNRYTDDVPIPVGTLSDGVSEVLPLFARRNCAHRDRYFYHTFSNGLNPGKVPVHFKSKNCMKDNIGCEAVYDEDHVSIPTPGSSGTYKVELYGSLP